MSPEKRAHQPRAEQIWNLTGMTGEQLDEISTFIGGAAPREILYGLNAEFEQLDTVIMQWGDERLESVLESLTAQSGYLYGAERTRLVTSMNTRLVALADIHAIWMDIVPIIPTPIEYILDEKGEVDPFLQQLANPQLDPNAVFYEWSPEG